jgi:hypothetical protein
MGGLLALVACASLAAAEAPQETEVREPEDFTKLSLEELAAIKVPNVYGASKHEQKTTEAPSAVSIVSADEIKKQGYRTLGGILRSVRGFYVNFDRAYDAIGVRGVNRPGDYGGRILITVDGHRLNDPVYDRAPRCTETTRSLASSTLSPARAATSAARSSPAPRAASIPTPAGPAMGARSPTALSSCSPARATTARATGGSITPSFHPSTTA